MNTIYEFLKETDGKPSMTRLLCLLSFFPASYVLVKAGTEEALGLYLGAYVLGYLGGKHGWSGSIERREVEKEIKVEAKGSEKDQGRTN